MSLMHQLKASSNSTSAISSANEMSGGKTLTQLQVELTSNSETADGTLQPQLSDNADHRDSSNGNNMPGNIGRRMLEKYSSESLQNGTLTAINKINVSRKWTLPDRAKPGPKRSTRDQSHTTENVTEAPLDGFLLNSTNTVPTTTDNNNNNTNNNNVVAGANSNTTMVPVTSLSPPALLSSLETNGMVRPEFSVGSIVDTSSTGSFVLGIHEHPHSPVSSLSVTAAATTAAAVVSSVSPSTVLVDATTIGTGTKTEDDSHRKISKGTSLGSSDSIARRRKQNRDAQRAYRERKANRIQVLENTVKSLQNLIEDWKEKYKALYEELGTTKCRLDEMTSENENLKIQLEKQLHPVGEDLTEREIELPHKQATSSHLNYLIENMKPMKAVPLKRRRIEAEPDSAHYQSPEGLVHPQHSSNKLPDFSAYNSSSAASSSGSTSSPFPLPPVSATSSVPSTLPSLGSWKPGSCANCQTDPGNQAFCRSIFERNEDSSPVFPRDLAQEKDTLVSLPTPSSSAKLDVQAITMDALSEPAKSHPQHKNPEKNKEYIPISDAYQRIKKHMAMSRIANPNVRLAPLATGESRAMRGDTDPALVRIFESVAANVEVKGRELEVGSIKRIMDNLNSHATS